MTTQNIVSRIAELSSAASQAEAAPEIRLRCDRNCRYGVIRQLVEQCAARGIRSLKFAVASAD